MPLTEQQIELMETRAEREALRTVLLLVLDHTDYHVNHNCSPTNMVAAVLPPAIIERAYTVLDGIPKLHEARSRTS